MSAETKKARQSVATGIFFIMKLINMEYFFKYYFLKYVLGYKNAESVRKRYWCSSQRYPAFVKGNRRNVIPIGLRKYIFSKPYFLNMSKLDHISVGFFEDFACYHIRSSPINILKKLFKIC